MLSMSLPLPVAAQAPRSVPIFAPGDAVEVWSNSQQRWGAAVVVRVSENGEDEGVQVVFEDERGKLTKMIPWRCVQDCLRWPTSPAHSSQGAEGFAVGETVALWSSSKQRWFQDGKVTAVSQAEGISVTYAGGAMGKTVPLAQASLVLRKLEPGGTSPASQSPSGASGQSPNHQARQHSAAPVLAGLARKPTRHLTASGASPSEASAARLQVPASVASGLSPPSGRSLSATPSSSGCASSPTGSPGAAAGLAPLGRFGGQRKGTNPTLETQLAPQGPGPAPQAQRGSVCGFAVGSCVAIWSDSKQKWFSDGKVTDVSDVAVVVLYGGDGMKKAVPVAQAPLLLKRLS
mmetsp:Transcript_24965/g.78695  ORF Transcript_24965/g.78695 Transcript_24965/m.78695 type:complete len:347 (+) Transcript_24965:1-1041(+)